MGKLFVCRNWFKIKQLYNLVWNLWKMGTKMIMKEGVNDSKFERMNQKHWVT